MSQISRYRIILLGHSEETIQAALNGISSDIVGVVSVGVNVLAIVDISPNGFKKFEDISQEKPSPRKTPKPILAERRDIYGNLK